MCSNRVGYVCPAVTPAGAEKQVNGWLLGCVRLFRLLPVGTSANQNAAVAVSCGNADVPIV